MKLLSLKKTLLLSIMVAIAFSAMMFARARAQTTQVGGPPSNDDDALIAANYGCPPGTIYWHRDRATEVCVPTCASDADCPGALGRCRLIDLEDRAPSAEAVLKDDLPETAANSVFEPSDPMNPPLAVCDPFYAVPGATDADLVVSESHL